MTYFLFLTVLTWSFNEQQKQTYISLPSQRAAKVKFQFANWFCEWNEFKQKKKIARRKNDSRIWSSDTGFTRYTFNMGSNSTWFSNGDIFTRQSGNESQFFIIDIFKQFYSILNICTKTTCYKIIIYTKQMYTMK